MNNKIYFKKKMELFIISLEALDTYYNNTLYKNISYQTTNIEPVNYLVILELIQLQYKLRQSYNDTSLKFIQLIVYINLIHLTINKSSLNKLATVILKHHIKNKELLDLKQYLKKFHYIYFMKKEYYHTYKSIEYSYSLKIKEIAITNLYLITRLTEKNGIYFLIAYLCI
uniref:Uncharacterized protein n=1 Tax=Ophidocladus simpliciusculus TaxID=1261574 RepID=A0A1Z1MJM1_9FLOR|nr:hypothetical protein [Ophidocladus simpliciusculus]ARW66089.1 hypothetical protein [Ophidocladus simpliciusculus]